MSWSPHQELRWVRGRQRRAAHRLLRSLRWWGGWVEWRHAAMAARLLTFDRWVLDLRRQLDARRRPPSAKGD